MTALTDTGELREPRFPDNRTAKVRRKKLSRRAEGEDVGFMTGRKQVTPDHVGDPLGAVVTLKPVVNERSAGSQPREAGARVLRRPDYRPPGARVVLPNGL